MHDPLSLYAEQRGLSVYAALGGEPALARLVAAFYRRMAADPAYARLNRLHVDLPRAEHLLLGFLRFRLGGPPTYLEERGHPRLRMRHAPFAIGEVERDEWVGCMAAAMAEVGVEPELRAALHAFFAQVAEHMRNR
jgi:hemoglobin